MCWPERARHSACVFWHHELTRMVDQDGHCPSGRGGRWQLELSPHLLDAALS